MLEGKWDRWNSAPADRCGHARMHRSPQRSRQESARASAIGSLGHSPNSCRLVRQKWGPRVIGQTLAVVEAANAGNPPLRVDLESRDASGLAVGKVDECVRTSLALSSIPICRQVACSGREIQRQHGGQCSVGNTSQLAPLQGRGAREVGWASAVKLRSSIFQSCTCRPEEWR